jgi:hypothetical protein
VQITTDTTNVEVAIKAKETIEQMDIERYEKEKAQVTKKLQIDAAIDHINQK